MDDTQDMHVKRASSYILTCDRDKNRSPTRCTLLIPQTHVSHEVVRRTETPGRDPGCKRRQREYSSGWAECGKRVSLPAHPSKPIGRRQRGNPTVLLEV